MEDNYLYEKDEKEFTSFVLKIIFQMDSLSLFRPFLVLSPMANVMHSTRVRFVDLGFLVRKNIVEDKTYYF